MRTLIRLVGLGCAAAFLLSTALLAQDDRGDWSVTGADPAQSGWQKSESQLTPENAGTQVKFLWKIKLGQPAKETRGWKTMPGTSCPAALGLRPSER